MSAFKELENDVTELEAFIKEGTAAVSMDPVVSALEKYEGKATQADCVYGEGMLARIKHVRARVEALKKGRVLIIDKIDVEEEEFREVVHIEGKSHLNRVMKAAGGRLVVVDFTAPWCGPCMAIKPLFNQLPAQYPSVIFTSVDTEQQNNKIELLHASYQVRAFPTFVFFIKGEEAERFSGGNIDKLNQAISRLLEKVEDAQIADAIRLSMTDNMKVDNLNPDNLNVSRSHQMKVPEPTGGKMLSIKVKRISSDTVGVEVNEHAQVEHLRHRVAIATQVDFDSIRLIFKGKILKDDSSIASYGVNEDGLTVHLAISGKVARVAAPSSSPPGTPEPVSSMNMKRLEKELGELESKNGVSKSKDAIQVMVLYMKNIMNHPDDIKYRSIRTANLKFSSKIGSCEGGMACMKLLGFEIKPRDGESYLVLTVSADSLSPSLKLLEKVHTRLAQQINGNTRSTSNLNGSTGGASSVGGPPSIPVSSNPFTSFPSPGNQFPGSFPGMSPDIVAAMQANPNLQASIAATTQSLMQDPAVLQEILGLLSSGQDPMTAMMSNPNLVQRLMSPGLTQAVLPPSTFTPTGFTHNASPAVSNDDDDLEDLDDIYADDESEDKN